MDAIYVNKSSNNAKSELYNENVRKPFYDLFKRGMDIFCALLALILLSPLFLITAIAIYIDDPGPVIFKQTRMGKDNKPFTIWKFRSMKVNAEEIKASMIRQNVANASVIKTVDDPRITRVGRFIRATSIDELPQLINILKGDMSVIGPRPFVEEEQKDLPCDRLVVKPGLSCFWQISGKNSLPLREQIELDRKYVKERSVIVDVKIIIKTMIVVIVGKNE